MINKTLFPYTPNLKNKKEKNERNDSNSELELTMNEDNLYIIENLGIEDKSIRGRNRSKLSLEKEISSVSSIFSDISKEREGEKENIFPTFEQLIDYKKNILLTSTPFVIPSVGREEGSNYIYNSDDKERELLESSSYLDKSLIDNCVPKNLLNSITKSNSEEGDNKNSLLEKVKSKIKTKGIREYIPKSHLLDKEKEKERLFLYILSNFILVCLDSQGNYIIQNILSESTNRNDILLITNQIILHFGQLYFHSYATRVIQKLIETASEDILLLLKGVIMSHLSLLCKDHNGIHIVYKYVAHVRKSQFIYEYINSNIVDISLDKEGCCLIQKLLLNKSNLSQHMSLCKKILENILLLICDKHSSYVVQSMILNGSEETMKEIATIVFDYKVFKEISKNKYSSGVIEKSIDKSNKEIINQLLDLLHNNQTLIRDLARDQYGNYILQRILSVLTDNELELNRLLSLIVNSSESIRENIIGIKFIQKIELLYPSYNNILKSKSIHSKPNHINPIYLPNQNYIYNHTHPIYQYPHNQQYYPHQYHHQYSQPLYYHNQIYPMNMNHVYINNMYFIQNGNSQSK